MKLLDIAKSKTRRTSITKVYSLELVELCMGWINGELGTSQVSAALETLGKFPSGGNVLYTISMVLREANSRGDIKIRYVQEDKSAKAP